MRESEVAGKIVNVYEGNHNLAAKREPQFKIARVRIERFRAPKAGFISMQKSPSAKTITGRFCECTVLKVPANRKDDSVKVGKKYIFNIDNKDLEAVAK